MARKQKKHHPRTPVPRAGQGGFQVSDRAVWAALCALAVLFFWRYAFTAHARLVGDGWEYLGMACNWTRRFTPWAVRDSLAACAAEAGWRAPLSGFVPHAGGQYDAIHFWLVSLLAAPFLALCRLAGAPIRHSFTLLHLGIVFFVAWKLVRGLGRVRGAAAMAVLACSPLVYWTDKAHSEFFVAAGILLAFVALFRGAVLEAALWLGMAANQQLTLAVFAGGLVAFWFLRDRERLGQPRAWLRAAPAIAAPFLSVVYTELRYGVPSMIGQSAVDYHSVTVHRALSLFIDPDIGLFFNWPLGLVLAVPVLAAAALPRKFRLPACFTAAWFALLPFLVSVQRNWNSGGTVDISRYALYFIPPVAVWTAMLVGNLAPRIGRMGAAVLLCAAAIYPFVWNMQRFQPALEQRYLQHTQAALWLYKNAPGLYDPEPEVFAERVLYSEDPGRYYAAGTWAVSDPSCTKLLLVRTPGELKGMARLDRPLGCYGIIDPKEVVSGVLAGSIKPTSRGYVNLGN